MIFDLHKRRRRERLRATPFPPEWQSIVLRNLPIFVRLPSYDRAELRFFQQDPLTYSAEQG